MLRVVCGALTRQALDLHAALRARAWTSLETIPESVGTSCAKTAFVKASTCCTRPRRWRGGARWPQTMLWTCSRFTSAGTRASGVRACDHARTAQKRGGRPRARGARRRNRCPASNRLPARPFQDADAAMITGPVRNLYELPQPPSATDSARLQPAIPSSGTGPRAPADEALMASFCSGADASSTLLFDRYGAPIHRLMVRLTHDHAIATDLDRPHPVDISLGGEGTRSFRARGNGRWPSPVRVARPPCDVAGCPN